MLFEIKQGDTSPRLRVQLLDARRKPVPLEGATVTFRMAPVSAGLRSGIFAAATVVDEPQSVVEYAWQAGDTDVAGLYRADFFVQFDDGGGESFPNDEDITVQVKARPIVDGLLPPPPPRHAVPQGGPLTEDLDAGGHTVSGLAAPAGGSDAATKSYVDLATFETTFASYNGELVTLASFEDKSLPFTTLETASDFLDRATIDQPTFVLAGVYIISVLVAGSGGVGPVDVRLLVGDAGLGLLASAADLGVGVVVSGPFEVEADDVVKVFCSNHGGDSIGLALGSARFARVGS